MADLLIKPIGFFHSDLKHPYEAARQPREDSLHTAEIILETGHGFEQALEGLSGFDRIWVVFQFHHNENWNPMVRPPRGANQKVGLFATRAPYRPNALGLSCLRLKKIEKNKLTIEGADLLDGTPIFDIKPYIPEIDSFPEAKSGWLEGVEKNRWQIQWSPSAANQMRWLESQGLKNLRLFLEQQLEYEPLDDDRKRVKEDVNSSYVLSYRTWRARFTLLENQTLKIEEIFSGYSDEDLLNAEDRWEDKNLHRQFKSNFAKA